MTSHNYECKSVHEIITYLIPQGLKDLDYTVQETSLVESLLDFEYSNTMTESTIIWENCLVVQFI